MPRMDRLILCCLMVSVTAACTPRPATVGAHSTTPVPTDAAQVCARHCSSMSLSLSAVVLMADNVGCVCAVDAPPPPPPAATTDTGPTPVARPVARAPRASAAAGGMAVLLLEAAAQQQQQSSRAAQQTFRRVSPPR